ncbi:MAG: cytochrome b/b6 domain-containing protein [Coriobacteriales bacterium]|jgi:Ni/Fe-hydrogenase 1 B-type cytochrome subunit|nr:cytochrome b/b6 domain-containing protein [Coriobacteriales bacterium]
MAHLAHYREAHPLPFVLTHWINVIAMVILILTGFYIHYPPFEGFMGVARGAHILFGAVLVLNMLTRVVLAFFIKSAPTGGTRETAPDYKVFLPQADNRHQFGAWIKYYLFLKKDHPLGAKYGVPQKLAYLALPFLILIMAFTGLCLWGPTMNFGPFYGFTELVGGLMVIRIIHYYLMWVFILFMFVHVYLANIEGLSPTKLMFLRKEHGGLVYDPKVHNIVGEDDLEQHGHH